MVCDQSSIFTDCSSILRSEDHEEKDNNQDRQKHHEKCLYPLLPVYFTESDHIGLHKNTIKVFFIGLLTCKIGTIDYFMYSLGETLNSSLKQVEKYLGLLNPTE